MLEPVEVILLGIFITINQNNVNVSSMVGASGTSTTLNHWKNARTPVKTHVCLFLISFYFILQAFF